jgi:hypothetical protein
LQERFTVGAALADIKRLAAWCEVNHVSWPADLPSSNLDNIPVSVVYPTYGDLEGAKSWNVVVPEGTDKIVRPLEVLSPGTYSINYDLPGSAPRQQSILWFALMDPGPRFAFEVVINGSFCTSIRDSSPGHRSAGVMGVALEHVVDYRFKPPVIRADPSWAMLVGNEFESRRRCYVGRLLPAGVWRSGSNEVSIHFLDLAEYPERSDGAVEVYDKIVSLLPGGTK